jgi:signal transduction histidine kinase
LLGALAMAIFFVATFLQTLPAIGTTFPGFKVHHGLATAWHMPADWNGPRSGLRPLDRIVGLDGRAITSDAALFRAVAARPPGTVFTYAIERGAPWPGAQPERLTLRIASQTFDWPAWTQSFLGLWIAGLVYVVIGLGALAIQPRDRNARIHALLCLAFAVVAAGSFDAGTTHVWNGPLVFPLGLVALSTAGFALAMVFPRPIARGRRLGALQAFNALFAVGVVAYAWLWQAQDGHYAATRLLPYMLTIVSCLSLTASAGWAFVSRSTPAGQRSQARAILIACLALCILPLVEGAGAIGVPVPMTFLADIAPVGLPAGIAYAIVRHRLFGIDLWLSRSLAYTVTITVLLALYLVAVAIARGLIGAQTLASDVAATALVAILFVPLRDRTRAWVDGRFFRRDYDLGRVVAAFAHAARESEDPTVLRGHYLNHVQEALRPVHAALLAKEAGAYTPVAAFGPAPEGPRRALGDTDLDALTAGTPIAWGEAPEEGLVLPIATPESAVIVLGPRLSGAPYSSQDRALLSLLTAQLGVSLTLLAHTAQAHRQHRRITDLTHASAMQEQFLGLVSHELRTPLATILGLVDLTERTLQAGAPAGAAERYLGRLRGSALALNDLVSDLLNAAQLQAGTFMISPGVVALDALATHTVEDLRPLLEASQHALNLEITPALPLVPGDETRIAQVLRNLLTNAIRYTPAGGELTLRILAVPAGLRVEVVDNGPGLNPAQVAGLFRRFGRGEESTGSGGVGLGLFIAKGLVEAHGGAIGVEAEPDVGCCFWFTLPGAHEPAVARLNEH